jgi:hypothetical protein
VKTIDLKQKRKQKYQIIPGTPIELDWPMLPRLVQQTEQIEPLE